MARDDHGIENEPHLRGLPAPGEGDPRAEEPALGAPPRATRCDRCGYDRRATDREAPCPECGAIPEELARHSVFNEPGGWFPAGSVAARGGEVARDFSCPHCGFNRRGRPAEGRCPECGELSDERPAPLDRASYASWLRHRIETTDASARRATAVAIVVVVAVAAVIPGFLADLLSMGGDLLGGIVFEPILEEAIKIIPIFVVVETRPYLLRSAGSIRAIALVGAALFAVVTLVIHVLVFAATPTLASILVRVVAGGAMQVAATSIAAEGAVASWRRTTGELREPDARPLYRGLGLAILVHAIFNLGLRLLQWSGVAV